MPTKREIRDWDVRVVKALARRGELDRDAYGTWLSNLPDEAEELEETETRFATPYADRLESDPSGAEAADDAS